MLRQERFVVLVKVACWVSVSMQQCLAYARRHRLCELQRGIEQPTLLESPSIFCCEQISQANKFTLGPYMASLRDASACFIRSIAWNLWSLM